MRTGKPKYRIPRDYAAVGAYLRKLRVKRGLTQRDVGIDLGYSTPQFISNFECGLALPPLKKLKRLMELYGGDTDRLVRLTIEAERKVLLQALTGPRK